MGFFAKPICLKSTEVAELDDFAFWVWPCDVPFFGSVSGALLCDGEVVSGLEGAALVSA